MNTQKKSNKGIWFVVCLIIVVMVPAGWILFSRFEKEKPAVQIDIETRALNSGKKIPVTVSDKKSGIRKVWIALFKDGKESVLYEKTWPCDLLGLNGGITEDSFSFDIVPEELGLSDGKAVLRIAAWDCSWRGWGKGNRFYAEKDIFIDTVPPEINVLSRRHNVNMGGTGLVIYKLSEPVAKNGVVVDGHFFPGHSGIFDDKNVYTAFFAMGHEKGAGAEIYITAVDEAGNSGRSGFHHYINRKSFRKDTINISDRFLNWKMPEFKTGGSRQSPLEKFLNVNRELRKKNTETIISGGKETVPDILWKGRFLRLPHSANRAKFADRREYLYNGKLIDRQYHMGIDLASVARSPVPAGNNGRVVFTGVAGIYGKTVVIDHGCGLHSTYSHLSRISVKDGESVAKGHIIGETGTTGLAGGDHLHYGMFVGDVFVNPVEWWDPAWIDNNITSKMNDVRGGI